VSTLLSGVSIRGEEPPPFAGPLSEVLADGVAVAPVTSGLVFAVTLTNGGASLSGNRFDLRVPGATGPLRLELEDLAFRDGTLIGYVGVRNLTGSALLGLRFDFLEAMESYDTDAGSSARPRVTKTRRQPARLPSPIFLGDEPPDGSSTGFPLQIGPLTFSPETQYVVVTGVVSGFAAGKPLPLEGLKQPTAVDLDAGSRVYLADGGHVVRRSLKGAAAKDEDLIGLSGAVVGLSVERPARFLLVSSEGSTALTTFPIRRGRDPIRQSDALSRPFPGGAPSRFDLAEGGDVWVLGTDRVERRDAGGRLVTRIPLKAGERLGAVRSPVGLRVGPEGVFVATAERITQLDAQGRFVRALGATRRPATPDASFPGALRGVRDLARGADGTLYVLCVDGPPELRVMKPF